ncbi:MAG: diguanylate cyclase [Planctomycetota bacterium]
MADTPHLPDEDLLQQCPRILIVEDDADHCELIADALRIYFDDATDDRIVCASTAAECETLDPGAFDVILLDYNLPDATGLDVLERFAAISDVPVIFVTGENVIETASKAVHLGAQDYIIKLGDYLFAIPLVVEKNIRQHHIRRENRRLQQELEATVEEVRVKNLQLKESLAKLHRMATTDYLTDLTNRRHFADELERCFGEARRYEFDLTCVMMDLDNYKTFNDTLGHQMGDKILVATARAIRATLRASDVAARYGGDEFVLLLPHTSIDLAVTVTQRIRDQVAAWRARYTQVGRALTLSMGLANLHRDNPATADALVCMADQALYAAKQAGRNRLVIYSELKDDADVSGQALQH